LTLISTEKKIIKQAAVVKGSGGHGTTSLRRRPLDGLKACLWDTWGLERDAYVKVSFKDVIQGNIPEDWDMENDGKKIRDKASKTAIIRRAHAVLFLIPWGDLKDEEQMEHLHSHFEILGKNEINPYVLLTHADKASGVQDLRQKVKDGTGITSFDEMKELLETRKRAQSLLGIPLNQIYVSLTYLEEGERNFAIDRLNYRILDLLLGSAVEYLTIGAGKQDKNSSSRSLMQDEQRLEELKKRKDGAFETTGGDGGDDDDDGDDGDDLADAIAASVKIAPEPSQPAPSRATSSRVSSSRATGDTKRGTPSKKRGTPSKKCQYCKKNRAEMSLKHPSSICHGFCEECAELLSSCNEACPSCDQEIVKILSRNK